MNAFAGTILLFIAAACAAPTVSTVGIGARSFGMANAYTAVANDYAALFWNPAGMAFTPVREAHFASDWQRDGAAVDFGGVTTGATSRRARVSSAGLLRSLPTTRGGYAFALGFSSPYLLDDLRDFSGPDEYRGSAPLPGFSGTIRTGDTLVRERNNRSVTGQLNLWNAGMGWQIAPGLGFGFSLGILTGGEDTRIEKTTSLTDGSIFGDTVYILESGYLGYDARIGLFYQPGRLFSMGARLELPRYAKLAENGYSHDYLDPSESGGWSDFGRLNSPWNGAIGAALHLPWALISIDATGRAPYRSADDHTEASWWKGGVAAGCELPLPWISSLLRAGYAWEQIDQAAMRITWDEWGVDPDVAITPVKERRLLTAGYSLLLAGSLSIEAAYGYRSWSFFSTDPSWGSAIDERHATHRIIAAVAIRY